MPGLVVVKWFELFSHSLERDDASLTVQVLVDGVELFSHPLNWDGTPMTVNRLAFAAAFATGVIPEGAVIELKVAGAPPYSYTGTYLRGLTVCAVGDHLP